MRTRHGVSFKVAETVTEAEVTMFPVKELLKI